MAGICACGCLRCVVAGMNQTPMRRVRTEDGGMEMLGWMLCVVCAIVVITGGAVWAYFHFWG